MTTEVTENVQEQEPRSINELLALDTYQGMTDVEIDSIIDYKVQLETTNAINLADISNRTQALNELVAQELENHNALVAMVQSIRDRQVEYMRVEGNNG
jgi:hypothetical protein